MSRVIGKYQTEDIIVEFEANHDYLPPIHNDPGHSSIEDVEIVSIEILGVQCKENDLPKKLVKSLFDLYYEVDEWSNYD